MAGFPIGVENMGRFLKNTCEGVHLLKLRAMTLQACNFTKNELFHTYFLEGFS